MRRLSVLNWALLCLNTLVFVFLLLTLLVTQGWLGVNAAMRKARSEAAVLGQDVYCAKGPFSLFVAKDFPANRSFTLFRHGGQQLDMSAEDLEPQDGGTRRRIGLGLGETFSVSVEYSDSPSKGCQLHVLQLSRLDGKRHETFFDERVDGSFDYRIVRDPERGAGQHYVFYQSHWQEVLGAKQDPKQDRFHKQLMDGTRVYFDMHSGQWASATSNPAAKPDGAIRPRRLPGARPLACCGLSE